ncbi:MAG: SDR family NAD(P)-dependent oxidoreductase [Phycisphaerales bacterium]
MDHGFTDRLVVITGGTGALGSAVAQVLLDRGARLAIPAYDKRDLERSPLADRDGVTLVVAGDLAEVANARRFYREHAKGLWASVHVAGGFSFAPIADADDDAIEVQLRMNAASCYHCCREAVAAMRDAGRGASEGGRIVNVAAKPALHAHEGANMVAYTASKAAVAGLTVALAEEVKGDGIWVNAVVPSIMDTPANRKAMPDADHAKWPSVEEVAQTISWLASPMNRVTRGALVPVYGKS